MKRLAIRMTPRERSVGIALVASTALALVAAAALNVAPGARDLGAAQYFHILATAEIPIVSGVQSALLFLPGTLVAVAVMFVLRPLGSNLFIDALPQVVFLIMACAQVWIFYRLLLRLARRLVRAGRR